MNQNQLPLSEVTTQLTKDCPAFTLPPLTPEQIEKNQSLYFKLVDEVLGKGSNGKQ